MTKNNSGSLAAYMGWSAVANFFLHAASGKLKNGEDLFKVLVGGATAGAALKGVVSLAENSSEGKENSDSQTNNTEVREIEIVSPVTQYGKSFVLVYGRSYTFSVKSFTDGQPEDLERIKWDYSYIDIDGKRIVHLISNKNWKNKTVTITVTDKRLCGQEIDISAYINNKLSSAHLKAVIAEPVYSGIKQWGELQNDSVAESLKLEDILPRLDKYGKERAVELSKLSEKEVRRIYEGSIAELIETCAEVYKKVLLKVSEGAVISPNASFILLLKELFDYYTYYNGIRGSFNAFLGYFGKFVGTALVLSDNDNLEQTVIKHFYYGNGEPLCWNTESDLSQNLKRNNIFQRFWDLYIKALETYLFDLEYIDGEVIAAAIRVNEKKEALVCFVCYQKDEKIKALAKEVIKLDNVKSVYENLNYENKRNVIYGEKSNLLEGDEYLLYTVNNIKYSLTPTTFFQLNSYQVGNLFETILKNLKLSGKETVLDAYCGVGAIGLYVARRAKEVIGIEYNKDSVTQANLNAKLNKIKNASFLQGDINKLLPEVLKEKQFDSIVVDPPRTGLGKDFVNTILKTKINRIVYVSCNPATLAKDLEILKDTYDIKSISVLDMFPNTVHVESITTLTLKK